jgi:hypothetical protein
LLPFLKRDCLHTKNNGIKKRKKKKKLLLSRSKEGRRGKEDQRKNTNTEMREAEENNITHTEKTEVGFRILRGALPAPLTGF